MLRRLLLLNIILVLGFTAFATPARPGQIYLSQPDGSGFYARFYGDELMRIKVTDDGSSIIQDEDGWWCYAEYDASGQKFSTGCRVGLQVSPDVLARSRDIPFAALAASVSAKKSLVHDLELRDRNIMSRIMTKAPIRSGTDSSSEKYGLVILVQFKGEKEKMTYTKTHFENLLMQEGYSSGGATGSAKEYFDAQFKGHYQFHFEVSDIITLDKEMSYYGGNSADGGDRNPHMMVIEACQLADADIDFRKFDQDGDGEVDNVFVFFAGRDEAEGGGDDCIWSHSWYIRDGAGRNLVLDGVRINRYACSSELRLSANNQPAMASIGTFCHEYAHTLGLPDLYDTDYQVGGLGAGTWRRVSLMDGGNYNNDGNTPPNFTAVDRDVLGLNAPQLLENAGNYTLKPIHDGQYFKIATKTPGEYFLLECRQSYGWDRFIGGQGMLIYHIDKSMNNAGYSEVYQKDVAAAYRWEYSNEVNALANHQCADLIEADGRPDSFSSMYDDSYGNYQRSLSGLFFPYGGVTSITPTSTPGLKCWGEIKMEKAILDIAYDGSEVTFGFSGFSEGALPVPRNLEADVFQDAAIITFTPSFIFEGKAKIVCEQSGKAVCTAEVTPYEKGHWGYVIEGLDPSTSYTVSVNFMDGDRVGESESMSFMTKRKQSEGYPYMYLANVVRADNGAFPVGAKLPLRLSNAQGAKNIRWTFNGSPVSAGPDCYYVVSRRGTLRAHITWEDGSEDVIIKEINIGDVTNE